MEEAEEDGEPDPETTLFVKNLNFSTTDEILKEHFCQCGSIFSATVAKKKDSKNPGQVLSMGYGFVQFWQKEGANSALKTLQNSKLDGHVIELKVIYRFAYLFIIKETVSSEHINNTVNNNSEHIGHFEDCYRKRCILTT